MGIVQIEADTLIYIAKRHIIPQGFVYLKTISGDLQSAGLDSYYRDVKNRLDNAIVEITKLEAFKKSHSDTLSGCQKMREEVHRVGDIVTSLMTVLPKSDNFPDQSEFLNL
jgi:glutamine synthetase type III